MKKSFSVNSHSSSKNSKMKQSLRKGDSYDEVNDDERKKNKILNMIKNAHVQRLKNSVLLKEINNAHDEIIRFQMEGDLASSKMMEHELNDLHASVIFSNIYPITKSRLGKSAFYSNPYRLSFSKTQWNSNKENLYKTMNYNSVYELKRSNNVRNRKEENIEEEVEEVEEREEQENEIKKKYKKEKRNRKSKRKENLNDNTNNFNNNSNYNSNDNINNFNNNGNNNSNHENNNVNNNVKANSNFIYNDNNINNSNGNNNFNNNDKINNNSDNNNPNNNVKMNNGVGDNNNANNNDNNNGKNNNNIKNLGQENKAYNNDKDTNNKIIDDQIIDNKNNQEKKNNNKKLNDNPINDNQKNNPNSEIKGDIKTQTNKTKYKLGKNNIIIINKENEEPDIYHAENEITKKTKKKKKKKHLDEDGKMNLDETSHEYIDYEPQDQEEYEEEEEPQENEKIKNISRTEGINESFSQKDSENLIYQVNENVFIQNIPNQNNPSGLMQRPYLTNPPNSRNPNYSPSLDHNQQQTLNPDQSKNPKEFLQNQNNSPIYQKPQSPNQQYQNPQNPSQLYPNVITPNKSPEKTPSYNPQNQNIKPYLNQIPNKNVDRNQPPNNFYPNNIINYPLHYNNNQREPKYEYLPKQKKIRSQSGGYPLRQVQNPYYYNKNSDYPQDIKLNFGKPLTFTNIRKKKRKVKRPKLEANILYGNQRIGKCFACDVNCSISRTGNSANSFDPYKASFKYPRNEITYYDYDKNGYYQYKTRLPDNY